MYSFLTGPQHPPSHEQHFSLVSKPLSLSCQDPNTLPVMSSISALFQSLSHILSLQLIYAEFCPLFPPTPCVWISHQCDFSLVLQPLPQDPSHSCSCQDPNTLPVSLPPTHSIWISHQCYFSLVLKYLSHILSVTAVDLRRILPFVPSHSLPLSGQVPRIN